MNSKSIAIGLATVGLSIASVPAASAATLYVSDYAANSIKTISSTGVVTTFATGLAPNGNFAAPQGLAFDPSGNLFQANGVGTINKISPTGVVSNFASGLGNPNGLAIDGSGNLFSVDEYFGSKRINKISSTGAVSVFASGLSYPQGLAFDGSGNLFVSNASFGRINKISPTGTVSNFAIDPYVSPSYAGLAFDANGNLFVAERGGSRSIYKYSPTGVKSTFFTGTGNGFIASNNNGLTAPYSLAFDENGDLFVGDGALNKIFKITPAGVSSIFATGINATGLAFSPNPGATATAAPEPFTIIGTLIGGTAALRLRKKLKSEADDSPK